MILNPWPISNVKYLTTEQLLLIHSMVVDETGGLHGVRDHHALLSIVHAPQQSVFGKELYPSIFEKGALYCRDIITTHPFVDGNKRTGMLVASVFLEHNGYILNVPEGEIERFALSVISKKPTVKDIAAWFKKHSKKRAKK